ncbi:hypothetical protein [uncultured Phenylobacterium sp.]|uniref:hypothetical protein n=1 Tax=uncultured Phenylobacterium sp. TaxID=349273 RepID=UPI0025F50C6B|nr:hypothetical protein [uncultured Phenylobacterium sp.]
MIVMARLVRATHDRPDAGCTPPRRRVSSISTEIMGRPDKPGDDDLGGWCLSAVYMMASRKHGTLYIGVTSDLVARVGEHWDDLFPELFIEQSPLAHRQPREASL